MPVTRSNVIEADLSEKDLENPTSILKILKEIQQSQTYLSQKFDEFNKRTKLLEEENKTLKKEVNSLKMRLTAVEYDHNALQNEIFKKHVYVSGVPLRQNESLEKIIIEIGALSNVKINNNDIVTCKRLPARKVNSSHQQHPQISVEFNSTTIKEEMINNQKINGPILQSQLKLTSTESDRKIYINEYLSNLNKKLLYEAQKLKQKFNVKFIWAKNGNVFIRQSETTQTFRIRNIEHLTDMEEQFTNALK